jgi:predicted N-acetyltransferase YhbS
MRPGRDVVRGPRATICAMRIRTAQIGEAALLQDLHRRSSAVWPAYRAQLAAHPDAIEALPDDELRAGRVRVAVDDGGAVLGFSAVLAPDAGGVVVLDALFVDPGALRQGIGRALLEDAAARARATGAVAMTVVGGPETAGFYEGCGFAAVADAPTRFGPATLRRRAL